MNLKPKVALAQDFLANLPGLPGHIQGKVLKWALKFQNDPTAAGIHYESIRGARDQSLRSVRIDQDWRGIVFKPDKGDVYVLMYVDRHDAAYRWAENRRVAIHPMTGAMQVFSVESIVEPALDKARHGVPPESSNATVGVPEPKPTPLYGHLSDEDLLSLGTPSALLGQVRGIASESELDAMQPFLPVEAYEGLFLVAAGDAVGEVLASRETRVGRPVDTTDFATALSTAESQARFVVVDDEETMAAILNAPLAQWRIFLHPTQRKLAQGHRSGPMRVLGGAGTGKTVLAMHRAKWLAENAVPEGGKVFFTTFTRNLAHDIQGNLKTLCTAPTLRKIEVQNLDAWVRAFLRRHRYEYEIVFSRDRDAEARAAWQQALALADPTLGLPASFYEEEFERVVLAQGVTSRDEYRQARRIGRGTVLNRAKRDAIWPVFEGYRTGLTSRKRKEVDDAYRDAVRLLEGKPLDFSCIVVDETQDFGPQALRLLRAMAPQGPNDLFLVGDGHQRIYQRHRASMTSCGIDIRGRSRKLYLNYRTTEEIRRLAVAMLEGCEVDDLDEGSDEVRRYKSVAHGPSPVVHEVAHLEDAHRRMAPIVRAALGRGHTICVMVAAVHEAEAVAKVLQNEGLDVLRLGPEQHDASGSTAARVATMHRAKGLEFDEVLVLLTQPGGTLQPEVSDPRRLHYVAVSRAKKMATVIRVG